MVAVISVVINHLTGDPVGGFVGVDVFFVISGYLITGHLVRDLGKGRGVGEYLAGFYRRRIRRLLPAALLTLALTLLAAHALVSPARFTQTAQDGGWAAVFWANWHLISVGTNYFTADQAPSPIQHFWSLSVEEQFYFAWPVVLFLGSMVAGMRVAGGRLSAVDRRRAAAVLAGLLTVASLAVGLLLSRSNPVAAYFSTFTRAWELGAGALVACLPRPRLSSLSLTAMSWAGMAMIGASLFVVHGGRGFPAPGALLPALGAALVLGAVSETEFAANIVLTNRASVFVGNISYSVYLVHFPVIVLLAAKMTSKDGYYYAASILLTASISLAMYALVEQPILRSRFLLPKTDKPAPAAGKTRDFALAAGGLAACGLLALTLWPGTSTAAAAQYEQIASALGSPAAAPGAVAPSAAAPAAAQTAATPALDSLQTEIKAGVLAEAWPAHLTPGPGADEDEPRQACLGGPLLPASQCYWGNPAAHHTIYLIGDSTSTKYVPAFAAMVAQLPDWKVRGAGGNGCPFANVILNDRSDNVSEPSCLARNAALVSEIQAAHPDVVVVTHDNGSPAYTTAVEAELDKIKGSVGRLVVLPSVPGGGDPATCYTPSSVPSACIARTLGDYTRTFMPNEQAMAQRLGATFVDPTAWYCVNTYCPEVVDSFTVRHDAVHLTLAYSAHLGPVVLETFKALGIVTA